jgi:hypothetical protein
VPSNNSKLSPAQARAVARKRTAAALAQQQQREREKLELALAAQRQAMELNEESVATYLRAESSIEAAAEALRVATEKGRREMAQAVAEIAERVGSVSSAAELVGLTPAKANALLRKAGLSTARQEKKSGPPVANEPEEKATATPGDRGGPEKSAGAELHDVSV